MLGHGDRDGDSTGGSFRCLAACYVRWPPPQFIYVRYVFKLLRLRATLRDDEGQLQLWTVHEMLDELPVGVAGAYRMVLKMTEGALKMSQPELVELLRKKLLPLLVAVPLPMTAEQLAWLADAEPTQVMQLLQLLVNLFPLGANGEVLDTTVTDWLAKGNKDSDLKTWLASQDVLNGPRARLAAGHLLAAKACARQLSQPSDEQPFAAWKTEYALRHVLKHAAHAEDEELFKRWLLDFQGLWGRAHAEGGR